MQDKLHDWIFHYNALTQKWNGAKRDNYGDLFSGINNKTVISSSSIDTLIEIINKTDGDEEKIQKLLK